MKAHLIDTHFLVPRSSAKVKVKYHGNVSQKIGVLGTLVFHKHIFFQWATIYSLSLTMWFMDICLIAGFQAFKKLFLKIGSKF